MKICYDSCLWQNIDISEKIVPATFLELLLDKGCKSLNLSNSKILKGNSGLSETSKLKYLDLSGCDTNFTEGMQDMINLEYNFWRDVCPKDHGMLEELLATTTSLEKLSLFNIKLKPNTISKISPINGQSLQVLNLAYCNGLNLQSIQHIINHFDGLKELNLNR